MQEDTTTRSKLLSGLGFYRLSAQRRRILAYVFGISAAIHVVGLAIFGGWIIMHERAEEPAVFKTPAPTRRYEPRQLEHRVKVQQRQRSSSRPAMMPRMVAMSPSDIALPEITVDPKIIQTTFQPKFKAVSGKGLGAGLGTGYGTHGFGTGMANVDFFGIRARGDKIAILMDVSVSMVEEDRGGVEGYLSVRRRVEDVIDSLQDTMLFTVIPFADAARTLDSKLLIANNANKTRARQFIRPFNTDGNWGLDSGNVMASSLGLEAKGGTTRLDLALTAAFEMGATTIMIISDGAPRVRKPVSQAALAAWSQRNQAWQQANASRISAYNQASANAQVTEKRVWVPPQPARPADKGPPKEGQKLRGAQPAREGYWKVVRQTSGGPSKPKGPPRPSDSWWTLSDFLEHLSILHKHLYAKKGQEPPVIHCIGYRIDSDGHAFLNKLARTYKGQYRRVRNVR